MTGLVTCSSVLLLARKRLERVERLLRGKVLSGGPVNEIERQVLFLARQAVQSLKRDPVPANRFDADTFTPWLATGISQYAVMGSVGPEITRFAARFAPGQEWLLQTLRSGNPDPEREQVLARSTDFLLKLCERIVAAAAGIEDSDERNTQLEQMRAFALGWACHIATSVASAPYIDAVTAELGNSAEAPPRERLSVQAVRGALEEAVSRQVYRRPDPRGGDWNGWLPADDQVPRALFEALSGAASDVYGAGARVPGSKAYNDRLSADQPPDLSRRLLEDGYAEYRLLTERGYSWRYPDWLKATLVMFLPASLMFPFAAFLPQGRNQRRDAAFFVGKPPDQQRDDERAVFEVLTFPLAANAAVPFALTLWLMLGSRLGVGKETIFGIVSASVSLVAAVAFFATLGVDDNPAWVRWLFLFAIPLGLEVALIAYVFGRGGRDARHLQLALGALTHVGLALVFVIMFMVVLHFGIEGLLDDGVTDSGAFWASAAGWFVLVGVLWLVTAAILNRVDSSLPGVERNDFAGGRRHYLRLFDDTSLGVAPLPSGQATPARLDQRLFPPGRVPVLKLWWEDTAHPLFVRSDRHSLVFAFSNDGITKPQQISAPLAPMTAVEFGDLLKKSVQDFDGNFNGKLRFERFLADEPLDPMLPTGAVFADHGDDQTTIQNYLPKSLEFRSVPAPDKEPYVLHLAAHDATALRMGQSGGVLVNGGQTDLAGPGTLNAVPAAGSASVVGDAATRFEDTFVPGDLMEVGAVPNLQVRVVVAVQDDQHLQVNLAFGPIAAGSAYRRLRRNRETDLNGSGTVTTDANVYRRLAGTGTQFEREFMPGDVIRIVPGGNVLLAEDRRVTAVLSPTALSIDLEFSNIMPGPGAAGVPYLRPGRQSREGFDFSPSDPTTLFSGQSVLDRAADLAALLCLGTASRTLMQAERSAVNAGAADVRRAAARDCWQLFRNWNLDHRRANEWRMLVAGTATSEKHGQPEAPDALQPVMPAAVTTPASDGEVVANRLGWLPLFARWLDVAQRSRSDTIADVQERDTQASNLELSRGLAFLLDLEDPA